MSVQRIDQGMAAAAARLLPEHVGPELRTRYRQLPVMLHSAGLAATYAFIAAKAGEANDLAKAYQDAGEGIRDRLTGLGLLTGNAAQLSVRDVLTQIGDMSPVQYARASIEATAFARWMSRLADAMSQAAEPDGRHAGSPSDRGPGGRQTQS